MKFILLFISCLYIFLSFGQSDTLYTYYPSGEILSKSRYLNVNSYQTTKFFKSGIINSILKYKNGKINAKVFYENGNKSRRYKSKGIEISNCTYSLMSSGDNSAICYYGDLIIYEKNGEYYDEEGNKLEIKYSSKAVEWYENGQIKSKSKTKNGIGYYYEWDENGNNIVELN